MQYIGKLNKDRLGKYRDRIVTEDIVLTDERKAHIYNNHPRDYQRIMNYIEEVVLNPSEILEDSKNIDTLFFINRIDKSNLNVIIKLNTTNSKEHPKNSIMTAWIIRDSNLKKLDKAIKLFTKVNKNIIIKV